MKQILTALLAALFIAGVVGQADAKSHKKKQKNYTSEQGKYKASRTSGNSRQGAFDETQYYERLLSAIPFGTQAWWRQLDREYAHQH